MADLTKVILRFITFTGPSEIIEKYSELLFLDLYESRVEQGCSSKFRKKMK